MAVPRRFFSETSMVITWCLRATNELRTCVSASRSGAHLGTNSIGEVSQDRRVQSVGLGQCSGGLGEVPDLTRVGDHNRQPCNCQSCHQRQFQ